MSNILTAQEHKTIGSTVEEKHYANPYTPIGIIDGKISIEECNLRRRGKTISAAVNYWGVPGYHGEQRLEPLDTNPNSPNYGQTLRDNALVRINQPESNHRDEKIFGKFPFARESKPRIELETSPKA